MELLELYTYELTGSWWVSWIPFGHGVIADYMIWKTNRKLARYEKFKKNINSKGGTIKNGISVIEKLR